MMDRASVNSAFAKQVADTVIARLLPTLGLVPVGVTARHIHLCQEDINALYGKDYQLASVRKLTQPGQFITNDFVELVGEKSSIKLRVLGPPRVATQVEILRSDAHRIGLDAPVRHSGVLDGTPGGLLRTANGTVRISSGVIIPDRHLHLSESEAETYGLQDGDHIRVFIKGDRPGILDNVVVRAGKSHALDLHLDVDDANAFGLRQGDLLRLAK